jgi:glycosyltransferase involved in cell wall biosynthesis
MLRTALEQFCKLHVPAGLTWEVLVVDNGSTDETPGVLEEFRSRLPLRPLRLDTPGKSNALNHATAHASGEYLLWTDDDVLVDGEWVSAYVSAFRRWPDASFFGGPVEPWFDGTPPAWLADHWQRVGNVFAVRQFGETAFAFDAERIPYGANFAIKTSVQREYPYDPSLGPRPGSEVRGEETAIIRRMLDAGHTGWWVPGARVQHFVPRHRQSLSYLRHFFVGQGEVQSRLFGRGDVPRLFGRPRWLLRRALAAEARYRWSRATASPEVWLDRLIEAATAWGHLKAAP